MRTVQMTPDEAREALRDALRRLRIRELEKRHRDGYTRRPVGRGELSIWEGEQVWPE